MFTALVIAGEELPSGLMVGKEMVGSLAYAHTLGNLPLDICRDFLLETLDLAERANTGMAKESSLDPKREGEIESLVAQTIAKITDAHRTYISRFN